MREQGISYAAPDRGATTNAVESGRSAAAPPSGSERSRPAASAIRPLWSGFRRSAHRFPVRPALLADGQTLSYTELDVQARRLAATLQARAEFSATPLTAVLAYRTPTAFAGVLGALFAGNGYVPLNRQFPPARTQLMFKQSGCRSVIVDKGSLDQLGAVLDDAEEPVLALIPEVDDVASLQQRWPRHTILGAAELAAPSAWQEPKVRPDAVAYLLFTSGSTGIPKGVMVAHSNVVAFLDYIVERYGITESDRLSQMFDQTFDLSVFDMFVAWERGACLCCPSRKALMNPAGFIRRHELTVWFSVPSTAVFMKKLGALKPDSLPTLRLSLFCGEPLPMVVAAAWAEAAPQSVLENLYGPTELTIACTVYRWDRQRSEREAEMGIVPIGAPFDGMKVLVANEDLATVSAGETGELLMTGPQMTLGYWRDPNKTAAAFVVPPGETEVYYRTGDRVRRPLGKGPLTHLGRMDAQIKIRGHRVELGEIEAAVRDTCGLDGVVAVPWPITENGCEAVEVFVQGPALELDPLWTTLAAKLPDYMIPRRLHFVEALPLNVNGKFDRKALAVRLKKEVRVA